MRKPINVKPKDWVRMMFCIKHLMKLHPEYNEMIMPFYSKLYDMYPYDEENPFHFKEWEKSYSLDKMIWDLGMNLPSWDDDLPNGENNEE